MNVNVSLIGPSGHVEVAAQDGELKFEWRDATDAELAALKASLESIRDEGFGFKSNGKRASVKDIAAAIKSKMGVLTVEGTKDEIARLVSGMLQDAVSKGKMVLVMGEDGTWSISGRDVSIKPSDTKKVKVADVPRGG